MKLNTFSERMFTALVITAILTTVFVSSCGGKKNNGSETQGESKAPTLTSDKRVVKNGDTIQIHFMSQLENGTVVSGTRKGTPLEFVVGSGAVVPGLNQAVIGMALDEQRTVNIPAEMAYGVRRENLTREFDRAALPGDVEYKEGMILRLTAANGRELPGTVLEVTDEKITVDLNHPLAGRNLIYTIKVVGIE